MRCLIFVLMFLLGILGCRAEDTVKVYFYYARTGAKTASGKVVNNKKIRSGEQRLIAISRDLRKKYRFGDSVWVEGYGRFVVADLMHQRHRKTIDILVARGKEAKNGVSIRMKHLR